MYIGSKSDSTLLQIFKIGLEELIRSMGLPAELRYVTQGCEMFAQAEDFQKRVDLLRIVFPMKEGASPQTMSDTLSEAKIVCRVQSKDGVCTLTVPPFELRHIPKLKVIDEVVEANALRSLRSQTWELIPE